MYIGVNGVSSKKAAVRLLHVLRSNRQKSSNGLDRPYEYLLEKGHKLATVTNWTPLQIGHDQ